MYQDFPINLRQKIIPPVCDELNSADFRNENDDAHILSFVTNFILSPYVQIKLPFIRIRIYIYIEILYIYKYRYIIFSVVHKLSSGTSST